jgi:hypothetical protein
MARRRKPSSHCRSFIWNCRARCRRSSQPARSTNSFILQCMLTGSGTGQANAEGFHSEFDHSHNKLLLRRERRCRRERPQPQPAGAVCAHLTRRPARSAFAPVVWVVGRRAPRQVAENGLIAKFLLSGLTGAILAQIHNLIVALVWPKNRIFAVFSPLSVPFRSQIQDALPRRRRKLPMVSTLRMRT